MSSTRAIRTGMEVYGADHQLLGTVDGLEGDAIRVGGRLLPLGTSARVRGDRVYLDGMDTPATTGTQADAIVVPLAEERLRVETRPAEVGEVAIARHTIEEAVAVPVELQREEVRVEERNLADRSISAEEAERLFEAGTLRVPVRGEAAVVTKAAVVTGEVVVGKEQVVERQQITDTVREVEIEVDVDEVSFQQALTGFVEHFAQRQVARQQASHRRIRARQFEDAEPNYRAGFAAGREQRSRGRAFEQVEPELRRTYDAGGDDEAWAEVREEFRAGYDRARVG